ncbi:MAG: adenine phosphoribosyltransferase [Thermoanaerobacteraceae bacterium]|uniref:Adenine phosphoribosyltransferase n=1 Tax=Desulfofundulus thermobenzoicus TaxID=29376 RepID=A0A6N7IQH1_9FIRM|nr:adenine phosphoribosyltransferase [Desulfofundulus thermobenzoicus]MBE3589158.1 adenine phosphoribosyltransferase [Thermoanaerobacteraceae bacterium]MQL52171.1 adenine phosphoribosyltransferase [Desulfofundulus thermobenzoicus]HHW42831.1 adenine phosphoribosyltransferase [Desulfotomaculum sp.]
MDLKSKIRVIPDYPREGISYKDITTLLRDGRAFRYAVQHLAGQCQHKEADLVVCPKARGLMIGAPMAYILGTGLVVLRKPGQLPGEVFTWHYDVEFGGDALEVHRDAIEPGQKVLVVDELLATGGTAHTAIKLVEELGGEVVGAAFLIELTGLGGRYKLRHYDTISLVQYNY